MHWSAVLSPACRRSSRSTSSTRPLPSARQAFSDQAQHRVRAGRSHTYCRRRASIHCVSALAFYATSYAPDASRRSSSSPVSQRTIASPISPSRSESFSCLQPCEQALRHLRTKPRFGLTPQQRTLPLPDAFLYSLLDSLLNSLLDALANPRLRPATHALFQSHLHVLQRQFRRRRLRFADTPLQAPPQRPQTVRERTLQLLPDGRIQPTDQKPRQPRQIGRRAAFLQQRHRPASGVVAEHRRRHVPLVKHYVPLSAIQRSQGSVLASDHRPHNAVVP